MRHEIQTVGKRNRPELAKRKQKPFVEPKPRPTRVESHLGAGQNRHRNPRKKQRFAHIFAVDIAQTPSTWHDPRRRNPIDDDVAESRDHKPNHGVFEPQTIIARDKPYQCQNEATQIQIQITPKSKRTNARRWARRHRVAIGPHRDLRRRHQIHIAILPIVVAIAAHQIAHRFGQCQVLHRIEEFARFRRQRSTPNKAHSGNIRRPAHGVRRATHRKRLFANMRLQRFDLIDRYRIDVPFRQKRCHVFGALARQCPQKCRKLAYLCRIAR